MNALPTLLLLGVLLATGAGPAAVAGHYVPQAGDQFHYYETTFLGSGTGNYTGYTESTFVNGTVRVTAVAPNGTESAAYSNTDTWSNDTGAGYSWASSGTFTFSAATFHYIQGTDNQTGYSNPFVWFYMNNSLASGSSFYLLNTQCFVESTNYAYHVGTPLDEYVSTIYAEGSGSYQRNDVYGQFTAAYTWESYFDPSTGYVVGYLYTEHDSDPSGDGFTITDSLYVTSTSYALTPTSAPASSSSSGLSDTLLLALVLVVVVVVIIIVVAVVLARSRRAKLPRHSATGNIGFGPPPMPPVMGAPPPVRLTPSGQPAVQQVVIRETVKVPCRYCGTLIDSTATVCPVCGAPRT